MRNFFLITFCLALFFCEMPAVSKPVPLAGAVTGSIVAVVNDKPISKADLDARIQMAILSSGLDNTQQTYDYLAPQVLKVMIDEELQLQRTDQFKMEVTQAEIDHAIENIEQRNGMHKGQLRDMFQKNNVPFRVMEKHIRASLLWRDYIRSRFEPQVQVSEKDIDSYLAEHEASKKENQVMLAEIFLSFDSAESEEKVRQNAFKMVEKMRQGAHFSALAQEFSSSPSAARGGDIGWIAPSRLAKPLQEAIARTKVGELTEPVRTKDGYYILFVRDQCAAGENAGKDTLLTFNQMLIALSPNAGEEEVNRALLRAKGLGEHAKSCDMMATLTKNDRSIQLQKITKASVREMPVELRNLLLSLQVQRASKPVLAESGVMLFMVCEKEDINPQDPSRDEVKAILTERKLASHAQWEMQKIRRMAHISTQK
jgi:peptidyl-prolyl cis-trans isomerase SurA